MIYLSWNQCRHDFFIYIRISRAMFLTVMQGVYKIKNERANYFPVSLEVLGGMALHCTDLGFPPPLSTPPMRMSLLNVGKLAIYTESSNSDPAAQKYEYGCIRIQSYDYNDTGNLEGMVLTE